MLMKYMNPGDMLAKAKKKHDMLSSILVLVAASIIFAVSSVIGLSKTTALPSVMGFGFASVAISVFGLVFIGGLFFGWLLTLAANTLGHKGGFFDGLTSVVYSLLYLSMGLLLSSLFGLIPNTVAVIVASFASMTVFGVIGYMTLFRAVKEFFSIDMLTTFIIVSALFSVAMLSFYVLAFSGALPTTMLGGTGVLAD